MLRIFTFLFLLIHALIHLLGCISAWMPGYLPSFSTAVTPVAGLCWLLAAGLFLLALRQLVKQVAGWWIPALAALLVSQVLVMVYWPDAGWGTAPNAVILLAVTAGYGNWSFERKWQKEVRLFFRTEPLGNPAIITEEDLQFLPPPVQRYLRYTGCVGKPRVRNMRVVFEGTMRSRSQGWFPFRSVQYNFLEAPARLFFMKGILKGIRVPGYHRFVRGHASMDIRLFGWIPVVRHREGLMNASETVTLLNDICLMAPAALVDQRFRWEAVDDEHARVFYKTAGREVSALLVFNEAGQLVNFHSDDRGDIGDMQTHPFSTPCGHYRNFGGYTLQSEGDAVWHYPDGPFIYGHFILKELAYNLEQPAR